MRLKSYGQKRLTMKGVSDLIRLDQKSASNLSQNRPIKPVFYCPEQPPPPAHWPIAPLPFAGTRGAALFTIPNIGRIRTLLGRQ